MQGERRNRENEISTIWGFGGGVCFLNFVLVFFKQAPRNLVTGIGLIKRNKPPFLKVKSRAKTTQTMEASLT